MKKESSRINGTFRSALIILIVTGVIGLIVSIIDYTLVHPNDRYVTLNLEMTYDGAEYGLAPNGEKYSINGIRDVELIEGVIASDSLFSNYDAQKISDNIKIKGSYPPDVIDKIQQYDSVYDFSSSREVGQKDYNPTVYTISLYDGFDTSVSKSTLSKLLSGIVDAYRDRFLGEYVFSFSEDVQNDVIDISDSDYRYQISIIGNRLSMIRAYAMEMFGRKPGYRYQDMSFNDIAAKCDSIEKNDLAGLEALIMLNSYSKSPVRLKNQYQYHINILDNQINEKQAYLAELDELVAGYEMDSILYLEGGEAVVKVDSNSTETYEKLIDIRTEITNKLTELSSEKSKYVQYVDDVKNGGTISAAQRADLEGKIATVRTTLSDLEKTFSDMITAFDQSIISKDSLKQSGTVYVSRSLFTTGFIKRCIKFAAPVVMLGLMAFFLVMFFKTFRRARRSAEA